MKKILLSLFLAATSLAANAQYKIDKDTFKQYYTGPGMAIEPKGGPLNNTSSNITVFWNVTDSKFDEGWQFDGFCDNIDCYTSSDEGLLKGTNIYRNPLGPGEELYGKAIFIADAAAVNTSAYITINYAAGSLSNKVTYIGYKNAVGITSVKSSVEDVILYPNPASDYIDVKFSPAHDVKSIAIYNLIGKPVGIYRATDKYSARCTFPADMPSGIYLMRVVDSKGAVIATKKITKQ
jgi:hypothetical protein